MYRLLFLSFLLFWQLNAVFAQCPIASNCTPGTAPVSNHIFGLGIYNVTVGTGSTGFTHATTGGSADGYQDFSCIKKATITEGVATSISISTNLNVNENVRVWVDLNNNGTFDATSELVFSSTYAKIHTGTITIPVAATVVKNTILRMRISAENFASPTLTPCSTPVYSQVEDYGLTIVANTNKPVVDFSVQNPTVCTPTVQFQNLTQNGATSYLWSFGDNTTSTLANPSHTYQSVGTYTIKLKACNTNGCDSLTKINYVTYHNTVPIAATCTPTTTSYCCGYGITKVTFAGMVNASANGSAGYQDFTCSQTVTVAEGEIYPIAIETSPTLNQDTWVYIDFNNNGSFDATELVFSKLNFKNPTGNITIPTGKVLNTPLRMRVVSDEQGSTVGACINNRLGQVEDYSVVITQPKVNFTSNFSSICSSLIQFTANNSPAVTSWTWDFGDGTSSTIQNPQHNYISNGIYSVKLKVCSASGCDSLIKNNYIAINKPCPTYCSPSVNSNFNGISISRVSLNKIDNISSQEPGGYGNYTKLSTSLTQGSFNRLSVKVDNTLSPASRVLAWVDFNRDGDFQDAGEEVMYGNGVNISKVIAVPSTATPGMTRLRIIAFPDSIQANSCYNNLKGGEIEDYSIEIKTVTEKPVAFFSPKINGCNGLSVQFSDSSSNLPTTRSWNFGDPLSGSLNTSNLQYPVHNFSSAGTYIVQLKTCNSFGCDSLQKVVTVLATSLPEPLNTCVPTNIRTPKHFFGIEKVSINTINNVTSGEADGYKNYACSQRTTLAPLNTFQLTVQTAKEPANQHSWNPYGENVKVWIDYNNNGSFQESNELVLNSTVRTIHTAAVIPPNNAVKNQPLRMRVANIFLTGRTPSVIQHCILPDSGEVEDYTVTIVPFTNIPASAFTQDSKIACGSSIQFSDTSNFLPTSWLWSFGDTASGVANTSTLQNPSHTFSGPGTYTITLTTCNGFGCNTVTKTNLINVVPGIAMAPINCKPQTISAISNSGIWVVRFGEPNSSAIYHISGPASEGYKDYSCSIYTTIFAYNKIGFSCQTFNPSFIVAWLDFNNDGQFDASEQIYDGMSIPPNAVKGVYLRLRVMSQRANTPITGPCNNVFDGQAQDYGVKILAPPKPDFVHNYSCSGTVAFTDSSVSNPTSWLWNFNNPTSGVNNTSTQQNPSHTFTTPGNYMVSLQACNSDGCQTIQKKIVIGINPNVNLVPACLPKATGFNILKVTLGNINYSTMMIPNDMGYQDYSCVANTTLTAGVSIPFSIEPAVGLAYNLQAWIDYDNDGVFSLSERIINAPVNSVNYSTNLTVPISAVKNTYLRMRVKLQHNINPISGPCADELPQEFNSQVEDYAVMIVDPMGVNENALADKIKVYPNPSNGLFTFELPTKLSGIYNVEVQDMIGKTVAKKLLKVQGLKPQQVDLSQLPKGIYLLKLINEKASAIKKIVIK